MSRFSTNQAAKRLGINPDTLAHYVAAGKVPAPEIVQVGTGSRVVHGWTDEDIERVRELLPKIKNGRKTRYRKKQTESAKQKTRKQPQPRAAHGAPGSSTVPHKKNPASSTSRDK